MGTVFQGLWGESGGGQDPFATCVYGRGGDTPGKLVFFGQYGQLRLNTVDLSCVNYDGTLPTPVPEKFIDKSNFEINSSFRTVHSESPSSCAAVEVGVYLCLIWNDDRKGACCTVGDPANAFATPRAWYTLREANGTPLQNHIDKSYDLTAIAINDQGLLLAAHYNGPNGHRIVYIGYFRLDDRVDAPKTSNDPGTWNAASEWTIEYDVLTQTVLSPPIDTSIRMEWYSYGVPDSPTSPPTSWLAIALFNRDAKKGFVGWLPIDVASPPVVRVGNLASGAISVSYHPKGGSYAIPSAVPLGLHRDAGGFIRIYDVNRDSKNRTAVGIRFVSGTAEPKIATEDQLILQDCVMDGRQNEALNIDRPVVPVFIVSDEAAVTSISPKSKGYIPNQRVIAYPAAEILFAHSPDQLSFFGSPIGRVQKISSLVLNTTPQTEVLAVRGIFDGPFPAPGAQLIPYFGTNLSFADVKYGTTQGISATREETSSYSFGSRFSEKVTKGVGPSVEASFKLTYGSLSSFSSATVAVADVTQQLIQGPDEHNIVANGTVFGNAMHIMTDAVRFLVPDSANPGSYIVDLTSPIWARLWGAPVGQVNIAYDPYAVTPGDVSSYTREAWNAKLQKLGYSTGSYFEDVILPNAFEFPAIERKYLELSLSVGSASDASVDMSTVEITESRWTYDASIYGGFSAGEEVSLFGFGEGYEFQSLYGFDTSQSTRKATSRNDAWGISVKAAGLPPPGSNVEKPNGTNAVESYTVRVYFLLPSALWTKELLAFGARNLGNQLDPNSAPWRIVYEVASYKLSDGTGYPPDHPPAMPSSAPTVDVNKPKYASAKSTIWENASTKASYYVAFANAAGQMQSNPTGQVRPVSGACPQVTIPHDTSSPSLTTRRLLYRSIDDGEPKLVKTIIGNDPADDVTYDDEPQANIVVLSPPAIWPQENWGGRVVGNGDVWKTGNYVSYRVAYAFEPANGMRPDMPTDWFPQSALSAPSYPALITIDANCKINVPVFPSDTGLPKCVGRKIFRTVAASEHGPPFQTDLLVGYIADNTTTVFFDYAK